jgi:hypothetical protein
VVLEPVDVWRIATHVPAADRVAAFDVAVVAPAETVLPFAAIGVPRPECSWQAMPPFAVAVPPCVTVIVSPDTSWVLIVAEKIAVYTPDEDVCDACSVYVLPRLSAQETD